MALLQDLSVQEAPQRLARVVLGLLRYASVRRTIEAVIRPWIYVKCNRNARPAQSVRIGHVLFEEEIETADRNVGWRQARHIRRPRGCGIWRDAGVAWLPAE